jgi:glutamate formiminotransferase/formiminotetrahydrofolate cyclodeaminase
MTTASNDAADEMRDWTVPQMLASLGAATPAPGGGFAAAHAGAVAAALAQMVGSITARKPQHAVKAPGMQRIAEQAATLVARLSELARRDAAVYGRVSAAFRMPEQPAEPRRRAIDDALLHAAEIPLETARACAEAAELCAEATAEGHVPANADAAVGTLIAEAACRGAALNVRVNIGDTSDPSRHAALVAEAEILSARAAAARRRALEVFGA